jgi:Ca2+/Na+ antiporter
MERTKLSNDLILQKIALIIVFLGYLIAMIVPPFNPYGLALLLVFVLFAYRIFYLPDNIEFDDNYMYIIEKNGEIIVDLKDIYYIFPRASFFDSSGLGKIKYHFEGSDYFAQFSPRYFSSSLKEFNEAVIKKNPKVTIKGTVPQTPFDIFDE